MSPGPLDADDADVTDVSGPLGNWRVVLTGCVAVLTAGVATVVVHAPDPATADTVLVEVVNTAVVLPDGRTVPAAEGDVVPPGAVVRTGTCDAGNPCGQAQLRTAGRDVYLGADSALAVTDGVRQSLEEGLAMVDSRRGAELDLTTRAGVLTVDEGGLVRVELGSLLMRVGSFDGGARLAAVGRLATTDVPPLHQIRAPYVGLPGPATVLALTGDAWEQRLAGDLVEADRDLVRLASGLAGDQGREVLTVAPAALRTATPQLAGGLGEAALSVAVAQAGRAGGSAAERLADVRAARGEGGSWGVVAALVEARVSAVSTVIDAWLQDPADTDVPADAAGQPSFGGLLGGTPRPTPGPTSGDPDPTTGPRPTRSPTAGPPTTPPTSPGPADDLVTTINRLLSTPTPTPVATPSSTLDLGIIKIR